MKDKSKLNTTVLLSGLLSVVVSISIFSRGKIYSLYLGDEKYLVGGTFLAVGLYALYLVFRDVNKK